MDAEEKKFFEEEIMTKYKSGQNLTKEIGVKFYKMFEHLTGQKKKITKCISCNKNMYVSLLKIYEASCDE